MLRVMQARCVGAATARSVASRVAVPCPIMPSSACTRASLCLAARPLSSRTQTPAEAHAIVDAVYQTDAAARRAPLPSPPSVPLASPVSVSDPRLRMLPPWYTHGGQVSWEFARFAQQNQFEAVFDHLEQVARERLATQEREVFASREVERAAALAAGTEPAVYEDEQPLDKLSKKARRRVLARLTSTSPSLAILRSLPRSTFVDAFQSFSSLGHLDACDYIVRRMEQIGHVMDSDLAQRWMEGIIVVATQTRQVRTKEKIEQMQLASSEDSTTRAIAATTSPTATRTGKAAGQESSTPRTSPSNDPTASFSSSSSLSSTSSDPSFGTLASPLLHGIGLPTTGLVGHHLTHLLMHIERAKLLPSYTLVRSVFEGLAIDNDIHGGLAFITRLYKLKYYVSGFTYAIFIEALAKHQNSQGCMFVFLHMEKAKFAPHAQTFNALIHAFSMLGDYQTAYRLMQDMQASKLQPDSHTFAAIINACCRAGKLELALQMFDYLKKHHTQLTTVQQIRTSEEQPQEGQQVGKDIKLLTVRPQVVRKTVPLALGPQPYAVIIGEYLRMKDLPKAIEILNSMVEDDITPLPRTYHAIMRACNAERRKEETRQLWQQLLTMGVVPSVTTYNIFMSSLSSLTEVRHLYGEMVSGHAAHSGASSVVSSPSSFHGPLQPDAETFRVLLRVALHHADIDTLSWMLAQMRRYRIMPDKNFLRQASRILLVHGRDEQARLLTRTAQSIGVQALTDEFVERLCRGTTDQLRADWDRISQAVNEPVTHA